MFRAHQGRCRRRPWWAGGGRPAGRCCASQPRPALLELEALPAARCLIGLATGVVGGGRRGARRAPRPARPGPPPAWPGATGDGLRSGTPALPAGRRYDPLPKGQPQPFAAAGGQGGEVSGGGGGGRRCGWLAARPGIRIAAGSGLGLTSTLSSAIDSY